MGINSLFFKRDLNLSVWLSFKFTFFCDMVFNPKIFNYSFIKTYNLKGIYKAKSGQIYIIKTVKIIIIKKGTTPFATSPN